MEETFQFAKQNHTLKKRDSHKPQREKGQGEG